MAMTTPRQGLTPVPSLFAHSVPVYPGTLAASSLPWHDTRSHTVCS